MFIYHDKIELVDYTYLRYRAVFIFIWECTRLLPNEIYSVSVKYIFDYKVKFLRYTRTYSLNGRGRRGMIKTIFHWMISFSFVSQFTDFVSFRRISFRFVVFRFLSFRCVSFLFRFSLYRDPKYTPNNAVSGDMGWKPIFHKQWKAVINLWCRLNNMSSDRLNRKVFVWADCISTSNKCVKNLEF